MRTVFVSGGTGYMGQRLLPELLQRGHHVRALARRGSEKKLPRGCEVVPGDPLDAASFMSNVSPADTYVHLVGVAHPGPGKAKEFRNIDLKSIETAVPVAVSAKVNHFVYVSVAHPAPMMRAYIAVRSRGEETHRGGWIERDGFAAVVRAWSRTSVALPSQAVLRDS